ncbi:MAG TPA: hypothetical protein VGX50_18470 [Longimicrobium sp.]|nr:hypothetical protein [Longimicrobium sp.]
MHAGEAPFGERKRAETGLIAFSAAGFSPVYPLIAGSPGVQFPYIHQKPAVRLMFPRIGPTTCPEIQQLHPQRESEADRAKPRIHSYLPRRAAEGTPLAYRGTVCQPERRAAIAGAVPRAVIIPSLAKEAFP